MPCRKHRKPPTAAPNPRRNKITIFGVAAISLGSAAVSAASVGVPPTFFSSPPTFFSSQTNHWQASPRFIQSG
jgi:hypothetical protein